MRANAVEEVRRRLSKTYTFDTVDDKLAETEFFLRKMADAGTDWLAFQHYTSAFLAAARTSTLALQQFKDVFPRFSAWYEPHRERLKASETARLLLALRNEHLHGGVYPIAGATFRGQRAEYRFSRSDSGMIANSDVVTTCRDHFVLLLEIVYDCYVQLGPDVDPQQYYCKENFALSVRTIDDAELEIHGWICESLIEEGFDEDARWHELRSRVNECKINHLFFSYLGKTTPEPILPEEYYDFAPSPEDRGWVHAPAGFRSADEFREYLSTRSGRTMK